MTSATMVDAEQRRKNTPCRLCLESIASFESASVDLLENTEIRKLVHDVYELEILPNDKNCTMVCMPCYQQLIQHYTLRMKLLMLRKTFRINQTMLLTQVNAFKDTSTEDSASKPHEKEITAEQANSSLTEDPNSTLTAMEKEMEKTSGGNEVIKPASKPPLPDNTATKPSLKKGATEKQLVPIVMDCLKDPLYRNALWPLVLSMDQNEPAPLLYLCSTCHKPFKAKEKFDQHQSKGCVPCCRYCLADMTADHSCPFLVKYASVLPHIVGSSKYVTVKTIPEYDNDASIRSVACAEPDEGDERRVKRVKLSERLSSVDRSVTPKPRKRQQSSSSSSSVTKNSKSSETNPQPSAPVTAASSVISVAASDDDTLEPVARPKSSTERVADNSRKRKRSTK